jgi:hypothetical protein
VKDEQNPVWKNVLHPGWIAAQMTRLIEHNYFHLPAIHTRSRVQNYAKVLVGQQLTLSGHFVKVFEKNGHHYAVVGNLSIW